MRRDSLVARLLVVGALVAVASVVGTAWLTSTTAFRFDLQKYGENQEADAHIADELTGYAATHPTWERVAPFMTRLSTTTGRRIVLEGPSGTPISDTQKGLDAPENSTADIDPLATGYTPGGELRSGVDRRAVGPYRLTDEERASLDSLAKRIVACIDRSGVATISHLPSGRPVIASDRGEQLCGEQDLDRPTATEQTALAALLPLVNACLATHGLPDLTAVSIDFTAVVVDESASRSEQVDDCIQVGRAEQLRPWVAPPVRAVMTDAVGDQRGVFDLTRGSVGRIALISALILSLVLGVTLAIGLPIRRRLRTLTAAAAAVAAGEPGVRVPVRGNDELARLSTAFNDMARQRQRSEELRMQLTSDVAHELRTPLTNLLGWLEAAQDGVADYDSALNASLLRETRQLSGIVSDLQTLTLADSAGLRLHDDDLDVDALLAAVAESHRHRADAAGVELSARTALDVELRGDGGRLRQVLDNLVANALDHTPAGGHVAIDAEAAEDHVRIRVTDDGDGISEADLESVFERFWRADAARSRVSGGSGLGLSIARKLVEAHGGRITVASEPGQGSVFTVELPRDSAPGAQHR